MNLLNILQDIEQVDPEVYQRMAPRRKTIKNMMGLGSKVMLASLPFAIGSLFNKAYGQTNAAINEVLNFALTLEYLEAEFYTKAVAEAGLIPAGDDQAAITAIRDHENEHVAFLKSVLGAAAVAKPEFDFTANGAFSTVFTNYDTFLAVANAFEDTGVRAYKGQAGALLKNQVVLTAALNIHSVEARHAAHIRRMRKARGGAAINLKPWITGSNDTGIRAAVDPVYAEEDNKVQADVTITQLDGVNGKISANAATEAFDEPLSKEDVLAIAGLFIV